MKQLIIALYIVITCVACDKNDYYHDSGVANGRFDGTVWEYLQSDHKNWDSVVVAIRHAGLVDVFDGTNPEYKEITFFGITNLSIDQFLFKTVDKDGSRLYNSIRDIPVDMCRRMILSYVIPHRMMKEEFDYEVKGTLTGGTVVKTLTGVDLRVFRRKSDYGSVADIGAESLHIHAVESGHIVKVASADIQPTNGVVHSLSYTFQWVEL